MQIACPACAASYQVPDVMIGEGRQMRCVRCGEEWFATPPAPPSAVVLPEPTADATPAFSQPPPAPPPLPSAMEAPPPPPVEPRARRRRGVALPLAWLASLAAWAGGLYALWVLREPVMAAWPPIARLYALLGPV